MIFCKSIIIEAPVEAVFAFHEREDALRLLSPAFPPMRVICMSGGIAEGSKVELKIGPFRWTALHTIYRKNRLFADEQIAGPFEKWIHRHEFEAVGNATRLTDHVEYGLRGGPWSSALLGFVVQLGLHKMFHHRHSVTKRYCERGIE